MSLYRLHGSSCLLICSLLTMLSLPLKAQDTLFVTNGFANKRTLSRKMIESIDAMGILDTSWMYKYDDLQACLWQGTYWFVHFRRGVEWKDDSCSLFAYNDFSKKLFCVTDIPRNYEGIGCMYFFRDKMFVIGYDYTNDPVGHPVVLLIDPNKYAVTNTISLMPSSWRKKVYSVDERLYVEVQPIKRKRNYWYYLFFWIPKGPPQEWDYYEDGSRRCYEFDKSLTLILSETIK